MHVATVKVKPSHPSQGDHVLVNEEDFDPAVHELLPGQELFEATRADEPRAHTEGAAEGAPPQAQPRSRRR